MANPQLENGHLRIANEVWDALVRTRIPGQCRQVLDMIIRKTWGFNKKADGISLSQFSEATELKQPRVARCLKTLQLMNLIIRNTIPQLGSGTAVTYSFNKDYESWRPLPKKGTPPNRGRIVPQKGNESFPKRGTATIKDKKDKKDTLPRKKREPVNPDFKPFILFWSKAYRDRFGVVYNFKGAKDGSIVSRLLKVYGLEKLQKMATAFFEIEDSWLEKAGYTLGTFSKKDNALAQQVSKKADDFDKFAGRSSSVPY